MIKNYSNSNIFQYLVYPFIKFETLGSPKMDLRTFAGTGNYLVSTIQKMDNILLQLDKEVRSEREIYFWDYDKLEEYLKKKYHYNFINISDCDEDSDEDHIEIKYFDTENNNMDVKVIFNKKNNEGYVYTKNKKIKKHRIPLITDYLKKKIITHYDYMIGYFATFCSPKNEEFILSIISKYPIDTANSDLLFVLSNDKLFTEALKEYRDHFDTVYKRITLYPNFLF